MPVRRTLNVSITPRLHGFIAESVASGRYQSASEVVREALRLLEQHEQERTVEMREMRKRIASGLGEARRGQLLDGDEVFADILEPRRRRRTGAR